MNITFKDIDLIRRDKTQQDSISYHDLQKQVLNGNC